MVRQLNVSLRTNNIQYIYIYICIQYIYIYIRIQYIYAHVYINTLGTLHWMESFGIIAFYLASDGMCLFKNYNCLHAACFLI